MQTMSAWTGNDVNMDFHGTESCYSRIETKTKTPRYMQNTALYCIVTSTHLPAYIGTAVSDSVSASCSLCASCLSVTVGARRKGIMACSRVSSLFIRFFICQMFYCCKPPAVPTLSVIDHRRKERI